MKKIDITSILSEYLKSRSLVGDLLLYIKNSNYDEVTIDFAKVKFATRSFMDEFYNTFVNDRGKLGGIKVSLANMPSDIQYMLDVVSRTQTGRRNFEVPDSTSVKSFKTVGEFTSWMRTLQL